ncbi:MAG: DUF885 family protein [Phycisphaerales bacterium]|nr:DUF885 family protein [Phycisphaerales bacterium]
MSAATSIRTHRGRGGDAPGQRRAAVLGGSPDSAVASEDRSHVRRLCSAAVFMALSALLMSSCASTRGRDGASVRGLQTSDSGEFRHEGAGGVEPMRELIERFSTDRQALSRFYRVSGSRQREERLSGFLQTWLQRVEGVDFNALDQQGRVDYILFRHELNYQLAQLKHERRKWDEVAACIPFAESIIDMEETRWRLEAVDSRQAADRVNGILKSVKDVRKRIDEGRKVGPPGAGPNATSPFGTPLDSEPDAEVAPLPSTSSQPSPPLQTPSSPQSTPAPPQAPTPATGSGGATPASSAAEKVEPLPVSPVLAVRAAAKIDGLRQALRTWFSYNDGFQPDFSWWVRRPFEDADKALDEYAKFLREEVAGVKGKDEDPLIGDPIGAEALRDDLAHEMMPYAPVELLAIAEAQFAWCEAEMKKAAEELKLPDWKAALEHVKNLHVPPGEQSALVARQAVEAIAFLDQRDLVTIPDLCRELWRLEMIDDRGQRTHPFAYYGDQHMAVAYAMQSMEHDKKLMAMRGNNIHFSRNVTPHELIPGHHLQGFMADRFRPYRQAFTTPFFIEGWALHWEMLLWDLDYARGPEDRIGMLFWRMHRAARIIVSLKFHLGQMQPPEMIDFLVDRVGHERDNATSEVRRYIGGDYSPLYQCGYLIGGLQIRALHHQLVDGGRVTNREFHDAVLRVGPIPIEMLRALLLEVPLTRNYEACWRFMDERAGEGAPAAMPGR